ncbi:hypothetical protein [Aggregatilinea lenta]|uniref:hypothetical protein n=1 Tax=Aggregatilinea lenta TaxID=913108 RepID=UPI000E5C296B|nr:hypothetical protein [Aggregatilinea lenta]
MRKSVILLVIALLALLLAACDEDQPPTQIFVIITATTPPTGDVGTPVAQAGTAEATDVSGTQEAAEPVATVMQTVTPDGSATVAGGPLPPDTALLTITPDSSATAATPATPDPNATAGTPTAGVTANATAAETAAPELFPTPVNTQVQIAEQVYETGRMFWIRPTREIWVMANSADDPNRGDWYCFNDTFEEGEPEIDSTITAPEGLIQPRRGFGKLWRNNETIHDAVGWATTPELELTSNYTYVFGGYVQDGQYYPGPGEHRLTTFEGQTISFFEGDIRGDCQGGTWKLNAPQQ